MPENHETWHGLMTWHEHVVVIFLPNWEKLWCKLLANRSFPQEGSWFREGTCHLRVRNDIRTLPSAALIFYTSRLDQIEVSCLNMELFRVHLAFFID